MKNVEKLDELKARASADLEKLFHQERVMAQQVIKSEDRVIVREWSAE